MAALDHQRNAVVLHTHCPAPIFLKKCYAVTTMPPSQGTQPAPTSKALVENEQDGRKVSGFSVDHISSLNPGGGNQHPWEEETVLPVPATRADNDKINFYHPWLLWTL